MMGNTILIFGSLLILTMTTACGCLHGEIVDLTPKSCTVERISASESRVTCPDGTSAVISDGQDGADGSDGKDGLNGRDGADGRDGNDGVNGRDGHDGADGRDGHNTEDSEDSTVAMIPLCSSRGNTTYGMCVNGKLYGNVWDGHSSLLVQLVPKTYNESSTGLGCTFKVSAGCAVTPQ